MRVGWRSLTTAPARYFDATVSDTAVLPKLTKLGLVRYYLAVAPGGPRLDGLAEDLQLPRLRGGHARS